MQAFGRNQMLSSAVLQGVVSDEFADQRRPVATGNGPASLTAPMISNLCQAGANPASTGEVILWGYLDDLINLSRRGRGTHAMVATLKRPPPARRTNDGRWRPRRIFTKTSALSALEAPSQNLLSLGFQPENTTFQATSWDFVRT